MTTLYARPYPVARLGDAPAVAAAAAAGDLSGLHALYREAAEALQALDPLECQAIRESYRSLHKSDRAVARGALSAFDAWEEVVIAGSVLPLGRRFRAFCWLVAHARYLDRPDPSRAHAYARGGHLPRLTPLEGAWLTLLPALVGLGPELPDALAGPCPLPLHPAAGGDVPELVTRLAPLSGRFVRAEDCIGHLATLDPEWRALALRAGSSGLLIEG